MPGQKMKKTLLSMLLLTPLLSTALGAQPESAAYVDGVLLVPQVLVVDSLTPHMVANAELHLQDDGSLRVQKSGTQPMARVQSITTQAEVTRGDVAVVDINVLKQWECATLDPVHVVEHDKAFYLAVTEGPVPENARCQPGSVQVTMQVAINTLPLQPGEYQIYAQGRHIAFKVLAPVR